jgi:hypothetical protein
MSAVMKLTVKNVIDLWFGEDTPIHQYKIKLNPQLWMMCQQVSLTFTAPSGKLDRKQYRKADKVAFAKLVLDALAKADIPVNQEEYELT